MQIQEIKIENLFHHPDNPRTDYKNIEELTESIKEKGIIQPLTVVKLGKYIDRYNVVAGNRRLEAAKAAGLKTCPCIEADMDAKEQAAIILIENMQRRNLTPYEEAKGVQMCLDLGMSEADIAKQTGFSKETIRHRKKLSELDQSLLKEKCSDGQISMNDLIKLEKVKDPEARNRLLDDIGGDNFDYRFKTTMRDQEIKENATKARLKLETFAEEVNSDWHDSSYVLIQSYIADDEFEIPEDSADRQYVYKNPTYSTTSYQLYAEKVEPDAEEEHEPEPANPDPMKVACEKLDEEWNIFNEMHRDFIKESRDLTAEEAIRWLMFLWAGDEDMCVADFTEIYSDPDSGLYEELTGRKVCNILLETGNRQLREVTRYIYAALEPPKYRRVYHGYRGEWQRDDEADMLYKFLKELGYEMCDNEKKLQAGTHEYFYTED